MMVDPADRAALPPEPEVLIVGAGPAGLFAAMEALDRGRVPLVVEADSQVGGIAKTVEYHGNRIDIGGHRFFSKTDWVVDWWLGVLPLQDRPARDESGFGSLSDSAAGRSERDPEVVDEVMLARTRLSRIYFLRRLFDYPVSLSMSTLRNLGFARTVRIGTSYVAARLRPISPEENLEDFMVNRFGRVLYELFFEDYTAKVWGVPCTEIGPDWGAQRIKGVSVSAAIKHAIGGMFGRDDSIRQKGTETSLISRFLYPKLGPGQLWESVARRIEQRGGVIALGHELVAVRVERGRVTEARIRDHATGTETVVSPRAVLSSMPIRDLVARVEGETPPAEVRRVADGLPYRDFMTAGLLVRKLAISDAEGGRIRDDWIYIQDRDVRMGRLQVFSNWSPYMVADDSLTWLGLEYFCQEGDGMWSAPDEEFARMAAGELEHIGIIDASDVVDSVVLRVKKAYPAYFGTYGEFGVVREYLDGLSNLFVMGRNGTHRYNNMDHSMLSARAAIAAAFGDGTREAVWSVNAEEEYHERSQSESLGD